MANGFWFVYVLYSDGIPVYVGCSDNIPKRLTAHKRDKKFNGYRRIYGNTSKQNAMVYEKAIICFLTLHYPELMYNKQKFQVEFDKQIVGF